MPRGFKAGGRKKGTPNKASKDVRAAIGVFAQAHVGKMGTWLEEIDDPAKRMDLYLRALEYHVPKCRAIEVTGKEGGPVVIDFSVDLGAATK